MKKSILMLLIVSALSFSLGAQNFDAGFKASGLYVFNAGVIYKTDAFAEYSDYINEDFRLGFGAEISAFGGISKSSTIFPGIAVYSVYEKNNVQFKAGAFGEYGFLNSNSFDYGTFLRLNRNIFCFGKNSTRFGFSVGFESYFPISVLYTSYIQNKLTPFSYETEDSSNEEVSETEDAEEETDTYYESSIDPAFVEMIMAAIPRLYVGMTWRF